MNFDYSGQYEDYVPVGFIAWGNKWVTFYTPIPLFQRNKYRITINEVLICFEGSDDEIANVLSTAYRGNYVSVRITNTKSIANASFAKVKYTISKV